MEPDDDLCLCFHVTLRKVRNYLRTHQLKQASQLSECHGAGTGCGWCRPFLERLFRQQQAMDRTASAGAATESPSKVEDAVCDLPESGEYARQRASYRHQRETPENRGPESG